MKSYEGLFIFPPDAVVENQKSQADRVEEWIKKFGGIVTEKIELGRRPLGYPLQKFREGAMWAVNFQLDSVKSNDLRKLLELQEDLLKYMITAKVIRSAKKTEQAKPAAAVPAKPQTVTTR